MNIVLSVFCLFMIVAHAEDPSSLITVRHLPSFKKILTVTLHLCDGKSHLVENFKDLSYTCKLLEKDGEKFKTLIMLDQKTQLIAVQSLMTSGSTEKNKVTIGFRTQNLELSF